MTLSQQTGRVVDAMLRYDAYRATVFLSEKQTIKATRRCKMPQGSGKFVVTIARPNYEERNFIKLCKRAVEPFPIKKIQFKFS